MRGEKSPGKIMNSIREPKDWSLEKEGRQSGQKRRQQSRAG
jgi:hypothetical protein